MVRIPSSTARRGAADTPPPNDQLAAATAAPADSEAGAPGTGVAESPPVSRPADEQAPAPEPAHAVGPAGAGNHGGDSDGQHTDDGAMERSDTPTTADAPAEVGKADTSPDDDRRAFKVALTYKPATEGRWHVLIAIGRDGCDPTFEPAEVADWPDALDAVPAAVAGAEAR